jgi:hypothetical protein
MKNECKCSSCGAIFKLDSDKIPAALTCYCNNESDFEAIAA